MKEPSTLIVGAGVVGVCTAYYLAKRGHRVTILESGRLEEGASKGNAGIIALGHPPLPRPGLVWKTIKWMLNRGSPLYVPPRIDFGLIAWMWNFRNACTDAHFRQCMRILAEWGWATGKCWDQIIDDEKIECEYHRTGWLDVFRTEEGMKHGRLEADLLGEHGFNVEMIGGDELRRREPAFRKEIVGAAHYTDSRFANPGKFVGQLADRVRRLGVQVHEQTKVIEFVRANGRVGGVRTSNGRRIDADTIVLAAGVWTMELAGKLGVRVPMQAGKGYHVNITAPPQCPSVACVLNETYVAVTPMAGGLRLAGTVELSGINHRLMQKRVDMLSAGARQYLEGIDQTKIINSWCGLRPCTADGLPVIGWAPRAANVFIATGHAKYGFAYGPITGQLATECILGERPSLDISAMRVDRF
ncbi:MAG: FAD-dependent oxidoreductase [Phycisphaerales bacterium]|nr:FAD-dependent oxidoreductase [Phycisphaerales bacterium]